jgi:kynureninase
MERLRQKSVQLTGYLEWLLQQLPAGKLELITPANPQQRGCQLSLRIPVGGKALHEQLTAAGVIADWREPDVIRVAPTPLYNSFEEVWRFADLLQK